MFRTRRPNKKFYSSHFRDPWKDLLSGHKRRVEATKSAMKLFSEVRNYRGNLFPERSIPIKDRPGYVTHDQNFFRIVTRGKRASQLLTEYFLGEFGNRNNLMTYGGANNLAVFFEFILRDLLVDGVAYYALEWDRVKLNNRALMLPINLMYVNSSTVTETESEGRVAEQKFSFIARLVNDFHDYQNNNFKKDELLIFKHPNFYPKSPVGMSIRKLGGLQSWNNFSLLQSKANADPTNNSYKIEKSKYRHADDYLRKQSLERMKIKRLFNQSIGNNNLSITSYYEVYAYAEYKKHLNLLREYLVNEFNNQLLPWVGLKNNIKSPIILECRGFTTNQEIDRVFELFDQRKISASEFVEKIKDNFNTKLY